MKALLPLILLCGAWASGAAAQADSLPPAVAGLRPGAVVRATLPEGRRITGRLSLVGDARIGVRNSESGVDTLRIANLTSLQVRRRHTGTGAIVGGIAGAGFGVFVALMANALCEGGSDCAGARPYLIAVPLFGSGGALVGAAVGSAFPRWKRIFPPTSPR